MAFGDDLDAYQGAAGLDLVEKREQKTFLGLSWGEFKLLGIAGVGFFMDAYDLFITSMLYAMVLLAYYTKANPAVTSGTGAYKAPSALPWGAHGGLFKAAANIGNIVGQLLFGFLGDILGRSAVYGKELILIIIAVILVIAAPDRLSPNGITIWITCFRVLMGIGIGGDYPMSAAVVSDRSYIKKRGVMLAFIKSNQGWGNLIGAVCAVVIIAAYRGPIVNGDFHKVSGAWRVLQGLSLIPAMGLLYFRLTMVESTRFTQARQIQDDPEALARANAKVHGDDEDSLKKESSSEVAVLENQAVGLKMAAVGEQAHNDFFRYFSPRSATGRRHLAILLGTALSWFCVDVAVYGINLNSSTILKQINFTTGRAEKGLSAMETYHHKAYSSLMRTATGNLIVTMAGFFPGYFFTIAFVEKLGRKPIQLGGFLMITLFLAIFAGKFNDFAKPGANAGPFFVVFILLQFFMNFGPNSTVFIIPAEVFPTRIKSSAHGLSAASGKVGAIIASLAISPIASTVHNGQEKVFGIFAGLAFLGFLATWLIPETKGYDADEIDRQEIAEELAAGRS